MAQILNGKALAAGIKLRLKAGIEERAAALNERPSVAVVQVGSDPASTIYINHKEKACKEVGLGFKKVALPETITQQQMLQEIDSLNNNPEIHGFIVQQPLPGHLDDNEILERIAPSKDIDCLHPYNVGLVAEGRGKLLPCTPAGIIALLDANNIKIEGKHCVIIGRSRIVGKPLGLMMLSRNATVTYCHSRTKNLSEISKQADILVVAIGQPKFLTADMIKTECVLVDVGISHLEGRGDSKIICGDVDYEDCFEKASFITPVPGGVGPMTVAILLENGLKAWLQ